MGILENGTALVENLVPRSLATAASKLVEAPLGLASVATSLVEALAINSVAEKKRRQSAISRSDQSLFSHGRYSDSFLEQSERLAALGGGMFRNAEWRSL